MAGNLQLLILRYGFAVTGIAVAIWGRLLLDPVVGDKVPYATVFLAVLLTAAYGGWGPALFASVLGALASDYFLVPPRGSFGLKDSEQTIGLLLHLGISLGIALIGGALHAAWHRADQSAQSIEERFRLLVQGAADHAIILLDPAGNIISWNSGAERIKGYTAEEIAGHHFSRFYAAADVAGGKPAEALRIALASGHYEDEGRRVRKDGSTFWASVTITPLRDSTGRHLGYAKITRDRTERKRIEDALRAREAQLQTIFENLSEGIAVSSIDGQLLHFNPAALAMHGFASLEECRRHLNEFADLFELSAQDGAVWRVDQWPLARVLRGESVRGLEVNVRHLQAGWQRVLRHSGNLVQGPDGKPLMAILAISDVTERLRMEADLRAGEERLHALIEGAKDYAIYMLDPAGKIVTWNSGAERISGYTAGEAIGENFSRFYPPEEVAKGQPQRDLQAARENGKVEDEGWRIRKDGSRFWANGVLSVLSNGHKLRGFAKVVRDLTDRRRSEVLLQSVLDNTLDAIVSIDGRGIVQSFNRAGERLFGYSAPEVLGQNVKMLMPEPHRSNHDGYLSNYVRTCVSTVIGTGREVQGRRKDGSVFPLHLGLTEFQVDGQRHFTGILSDLSDRKQAEEKLEASQRLLQTVFDTLPATLAVKDRESRYLMVNKAWCKRYGAKAENIIGVHSLHVPGQPEAEKLNTLAEDQKVLAANGAPMVFDGWDTTASGERRAYHCIKAAIRDRDGKATGLISATMDFTDLRRAHEELRASQRLLQTVFDTIPHHLVVKNREGRYLMVNKAWCDAFGRTPEEVLNRFTSEQSSRPPDEIARILEEDRQVFGGDSLVPSTQSTFTVKTGEKRYYKGIKAPLRDETGATAGLVAMSMDVTAEVEAQTEVDTAHAHLFDAIESLPAAFFMFDAGHRLLLWNSRCREFFPEVFAHLRTGMAAEELVRIAAETSIADAAGRVEQWVNERLDEFRNRPGIFEQTLKDGRRIQGIDRRTSDGGTVCLRFDVTELRQREAELRQSQKLEAIGSLAGGIAHDFNNLLTVIGSYSGFIQDAAEGQEAIREDARIIRETSDRAAALTRQLLAFSRRQVLQMRVLDLNKTIGSVEKMLQRLIGENIELRTSLQPELRWIQADETQIEQIILNLAVNARDAMPNGGELLIETSNRALDASMLEKHAEVTPGDYVMLAVTDTGHGMSPEVQKRIFEPFFTTKAQGKGTGMGLATVYGIVTQMKGFIFVYSEPGTGTTFKIYFPQSPDPAQAAAVPAETAAVPVATETVLLVEDEELVRRSACRILEGAGYHVLQASGPDDALRLWASHGEKIDLLLSDVIMPKLSGRELWDKVHQVRPIRVIFMSGYTDDTVIRHGILEGNLPFLNKPFTKRSLLDKVREVLGRGG